MKKIYIAGPDVFEQDSVETGKNLIRLCKEYGYMGLYPLDNVVDFSQPKHKISRDIFDANVEMIKENDIVIANLNAFRGKEPDSGTVWECGYAYGLGKEVYGYMKETKDYLESFSTEEKREEAGLFWDKQNRFIEDFSNPANLMIAHSAKIIQGDFEAVLKTLSGD